MSGEEGSAGPSFWRVARRPKWIAILVLALVVGAVFAWLGRWQFERGLEASRADLPETELAVPLHDIAEPQRGFTDEQLGRRITADLAIAPGDAVVLAGRVNTAGPGHWVVLHGVDAGGASIAVAAGWAATREAAERAAAEADGVGDLGEVTGRYLPSESPQQSDFEAGDRSALAVAELINLWATPPDGVFGGYLVLDAPLAGLERIDAPPPIPPEQVNLLNLFYAIEWIVFAGAAVFLWWRLVKDEVLKERDEGRT